MATCFPHLSRLFYRPKPPPAPSPPQGLRVETYTYSTPAPGVELKVDCHLPLNDPGWPRPAVLYFHGGNLFFGDRSFYLRGLCEDCTSKGWIFLAYDYRKLVPFTGHDIIKDLNTLFSHYHTVLAPKHNLSATNVFVAGYSSGGYVAQLAAAHWEPKPLGMFLVASQGGKMLSQKYYAEKEEELGPIPEILKGYLDGGGKEMRKVGSLLQHGNDLQEFDNRLALSVEVHKRGLQLDLLTGIPDLSGKLRAVEKNQEELEKLIPDEAKCLFPELLIDETFPPAFIVHGDKDTTVLLEESKSLVENLEKRQVMAKLVTVEGAAHQTMLFDAVYKDYMMEVIPWIQERCVADEGEEDEMEDLIM
ncbi:Alpha/Beta hydrolase protein [Pyronema domesticum]|nr:Alpha/Beta hydrolase protein [Pyronema domesticum]